MLLLILLLLPLPLPSQEAFQSFGNFLLAPFVDVESTRHFANEFVVRNWVVFIDCLVDVFLINVIVFIIFVVFFIIIIIIIAVVVIVGMVFLERVDESSFAYLR